MATTGKTQPNATQLKAKKGVHPAVPLILVVMIPLLIIGLIAWWLFGGGWTLRYKPRIESYLQDKYGQEFIVKDIRTEGAGIGSWGLKIGTAYPIADKSLTFDAGTSTDTGSFFDHYSRAIWVREETPRIEAFLADLYKPGEAPDISLVINIPTPNAPDPIRGDVPKLEDAIKQYGNQMRYSLTIDNPPTVFDDDENVRQKENIYATIEYIKQYGLDGYSILLRSKDPEKKFEYACNIDKSTDMERVLDICLNEPVRREVQR